MQNRTTQTSALQLFKQFLLSQDIHGAQDTWKFNAQEILLSLKELAKNLNETHGEFKQLFLNLIIICSENTLEINLLTKQPQNIEEYPNLSFIKNVFEAILNTLTSAVEMEDIFYKNHLIELKKRLFHFLNNAHFINNYLMVFFGMESNETRFQTQLNFFDLYIAPMFIEKISSPTETKSLSAFKTLFADKSLIEAISSWYHNRNNLLVEIATLTENKQLFVIEDLLFVLLMANRDERYQIFLYSRFKEIINTISAANIDIVPILQTLDIKFDLLLSNELFVPNNLLSIKELEAQQNFIRSQLENLKLPNTSSIYQSTPEQYFLTPELNSFLDENDDLVLRELMQAYHVDESLESASTQPTTENDKIVEELLQQDSTPTSSAYVEPGLDTSLAPSPSDTITTTSRFPSFSANPSVFFSSLNVTPSIPNPNKLLEIYEDLKKIILEHRSEEISHITLKYESYKKSIDAEIIKLPIHRPGFKLSKENLLICFMLIYKKYDYDYFKKIRPMMNYIFKILALSELKQIKKTISRCDFENFVMGLIEKKSLYFINEQRGFLLNRISVAKIRRTEKILSTFHSLNDVTEIDKYWRQNIDDLLIILKKLPFTSMDESDPSLWSVIKHLLSKQTSFNQEILKRILIQIIVCLPLKNLDELKNLNTGDTFFPHAFKARQALVDFIASIKSNDPKQLGRFFAENKIIIQQILPYLPTFTNYFEDEMVRYPQQLSVSEILFMLILTYTETADAIYENIISDLLNRLDETKLMLIQLNIDNNVSIRGFVSNYINFFSKTCSSSQPIYLDKNVSIFLSLIKLERSRQSFEPDTLLNAQIQNSPIRDTTTQHVPKKAKVMATEKDSTISLRRC